MMLTKAQARRLAEIAKYGEFVELQELDDYGVLAQVHSGAPPHDLGFLEVVERKPTGRFSWDFGLERPS